MNNFLYESYLKILVETPAEGLVRVLDLKKEAELALACDLSVIQDSFRFRALWRTQKIAAFLLDERGDVKREALAELIGLFENEGHIFFPTGTSDCVLRDHILRTLKAFRDNPNLLRFLKRFQRPLCHKWAERIIGDAVGQFNAGEVTDRMIRCAVLSACLVYLRQSVGSCFATAPAILIQEEQIENLLQDLYDLLTTGVLKRTFGGVEYAVPLSPSTGIGDLRKPLGAQSWFSPGLLTALRCTREELKALLERSSASNAEELIHLVLMQRFGLNEDDLRSFKGSQKFFAKSAEPLSRKSDQCQKMVDKEREAKAAFKAVVDHPLLKAWEFTIASLTEAKMEFSKWNLYASLGLHHEEEGGIGSVIYHYLSSKLDHNNQKVEDYQRDYEIAYDQLRATEILLKQASTESDIRRLKAEFQTRLSHMQSCLEIRDRAYSAASHYSTLFSFLQEQYSAKCPEYFQEIYDAEMQDVKTGPYEDSPAGFRLVYKHGRTDPSLWTMIYTSDQYIEALVSFFIATEHAIVQACEWEKGKEEIAFLTSHIIHHIRTHEFLHSAILRMAKAHNMPIPSGVDPVAALESMPKKPWAYTSGGTLQTLLRTYYRRDRDFTEETKRVESETELLIFIIDTLKNLPPGLSDLYRADPDKGMLMLSPSHAFLLRPGLPDLRKGWEEELFTYTWVRDYVIEPMQNFFERIVLLPREQLFLIEEFSEQLPPLFAHRLRHVVSLDGKTMGVKLFRDQVVKEATQLAANPQALIDGFDAFLRQMLPLTSPKESVENVRLLLGESTSHVDIEAVTAPFVSAKALQESAKAHFLLAHPNLCQTVDIHRVIAENGVRAGLLAPRPFLFADTNWAISYFGFVVNPGTMKFELWHFDRCGLEGIPMSRWRQWFVEKHLSSWTIFSRPHEYYSAPKNH